MESFTLVRARQMGKDGSGRATRERAGLSVREFARMVGVDVATLSRWERGEAKPRIGAAAAWVAACQGLEQLLNALAAHAATPPDQPAAPHSEQSSTTNAGASLSGDGAPPESDGSASAS